MEAPTRDRKPFQLRTNLDFAEMSKMSKEFADVNQDIEDCEAEVHRLQSHIMFLQNHRQRLDEYKTCLRSLMSPIRKLPNELVLRIFDCACTINDLTTGKLATMPALTISCVCTHWQDLAKSTPQLWSRIRVNLTAMRLDRPEFPILEFYLDLAQQLPLTVEVLGDKLETLEPIQAAVCATLGACSDRWKELIVSQPTFYKALMAQDSRNFPMLDALTISNFGFRLPGSLDRFHDAPRLHSLSVLSFPLGKLHKSNFPWKELNVLNICSYSEELKHLVEAPSNLKVLCFCEWEDGHYKPNSPPTTAPSVEALSLSVNSQTTHPKSENMMDVVLTSMTLPALTSLSIDRLDIADEYQLDWPKETLEGFLCRSSCQLTTLSIKSIPMSDSDLIDLLLRLPSLLHLTIDDSKVTTRSPITTRLVQNLHAFRYRGKSFISPVMVHKLQSLSLTFSGFGSFDDRTFVDVVSSRWYSRGYPHTSEIGVNSLRSVVMRFLNRDVDPGIYSPLKHLEKDGMRVVIIAKGKVLQSL
ncbi:hypothetical protein BDP27DRAFT_54421 [Rhodocollybia butyracea]|uniref:F-box domain-containing protein n=1 Tax=Rhodocollybia butyracea TaxID=206335 RepID=A0A9P5U561_9AGAR|nr:hypothetical protein BDP27DRAFT_54421 [Rhodocollybia butyracea]